MSFAVSETTQKILKSFSAISNSILLAKGTRQKTVLQSRSVFAIAELPDAWPRETAIYDLNTFIGALTQVETPSIEFADDAMVIFHDNPVNRLRIKLRYSDPSTIDVAPDKILPTDNPGVEFILSSYTLNTLKKTASMLKLTHFTLSADINGVKLTAVDPKIPNSNAFELDVPLVDVKVHDQNFSRSLRFQIAHFAYLLDGDYNVSLSTWKYAFFDHKSLPVTYFIAEDKPQA